MKRADLLAQVKRAHSNTGGKVSRLKRQGIDVAASGLDPRRDLDRVSRYNSTQLAAYLRNLNQFNSRSTKFVGLQGGQAAPIQAYSRLVHEANMYNIRTARANNAVYDLPLPRGTVLDKVTGKARPMTIAERDATLRPKNFITAGGEASARPFTPRDFPASRINGLAALDRLTQDMRRRNKRDYLPSEIKRQRAEAQKMLLTIGSASYITRVNMLSDAQFDTLWNYTRFADDISLRYEHMTELAETRRDRSYESVLDTNDKDINVMLDWAHALPRKR